MADVEAPPRRLPLPFLAALVLLTLAFLSLAIHRANRHTLRGDEIVTLFANRESGSLLSLLRGVKGQVSPAPMYYIVGVAVDAARDRLNYLGLNYSGYYRLPSILFTAGLGAAAALLVAFGLKRQEQPPSPVAWFLLLCGLAVYWFQPKVFSFAGTDRPYALWNGLWLLALAWLLVWPEKWIGLTIVLSLMTATATAACFQILSAGIAFAVVRTWEGRPWKAILKEGAALFSAPALLGAYYALLSGTADRAAEGEGVSGLLKFWLVTNLPAWLAAAAALALILCRPALRGLSLPVFAFTALLLMIPLIYALARLKGYSSPSRQYIWTMTGIPLALFVGALGWHDLRGWRPSPAIALVLGIGLVSGFSIATFLRAPTRNDSRLLECLNADSSLRVLLREERPAMLRFPPETRDIERNNITLLAEWIRVRYRELPNGRRQVVLRDEGGRLRSDPVDDTPTLRPNYGVVLILP